MDQINFYVKFFSGELWNRKWAFLLGAWLVSCIGIFVVMLIPNQYQTKAGISIDTDMLLSQVVGSSTFSLEKTTRAQAQKVSQIIYSTENLRNVLRAINIKNYDLTRTQEVLMIEEMRKNLSFVQVAEDYYEMSYVHSDADTAYKTLREILNTFIETNIKQSSSNSDKAIIFSQDALKMKQREYARIQKELAEFQANNIEIIDKNNSLLPALREAEAIVKNYNLDRTTYEDRLNGLMGLLTSTDKYSATMPSDNPECDTIGIERDIQAAKARGLTDSHPDVSYLRALLKSRQDACPQAKAKIANNPVYIQLLSQMENAKAELSRFDARYKVAKASIPTLQAKLEKQPEILEKLDSLLKQKSKTEATLGLADNNNDRLQETVDLNRKTGLVNYEIIQEVTYPVKPEKPNRLLLFVGAFLASILASAGLIILKVQTQQRMATLHHLRNAFDLPILGSISKVDTRENQTVNYNDNFLWGGGVFLLILLYAVLIYVYAIMYKQIGLSNIINKIISLFASS